MRHICPVTGDMTHVLCFLEKAFEILCFPADDHDPPLIEEKRSVAAKGLNPVFRSLQIDAVQQLCACGGTEHALTEIFDCRLCVAALVRIHKEIRL